MATHAPSGPTIAVVTDSSVQQAAGGRPSRSSQDRGRIQATTFRVLPKGARLGQSFVLDVQQLFAAQERGKLDQNRFFVISDWRGGDRIRRRPPLTSANSIKSCKESAVVRGNAWAPFASVSSLRASHAHLDSILRCITSVLFNPSSAGWPLKVVRNR